MPNDFQNVKEPWFLYDTIGVSDWVDDQDHPPAGWYSSFLDLGNADALSFFDTRNKQIGIAYNNQESRDQIPYAFVVKSLSVGFFGPACTSLISRSTIPTGQPSIGRSDVYSSFWDHELPQHCGVIWQVNQDERLKTNAGIVGPGYGPVGSCIGQGDMSDPAIAIGGWNTSIHAGGQSRSKLVLRWEFPAGIGIPRRATTRVELRLTEWARTTLRTIWGPGFFVLRDYDSDETPENPITPRPAMFLIQVLLTGMREVQQRGEYHA